MMLIIATVLVCFIINAVSEGTLGTILAGVAMLAYKLAVLAVVALSISAIVGGIL